MLLLNSFTRRRTTMQIFSSLEKRERQPSVEQAVFIGVALFGLWFIALMTLMDNGADHVLSLVFVSALSILLIALARTLPKTKYQGFWMAAAATVTAVGMYFRLRPFFPHTEIIFTLSVIGVTARWGLRSGVLATLLTIISIGFLDIYFEQTGITFDFFAISGFYLVAVFIVGTLSHQREAELEKRSRITETLNQTYAETIRALVAALDKRDNETGGHSERVTAIALSIAYQMHLNKDLIRQIHWGALLHDVGKIGIPDRILRKQGPLTDEEWTIMKSHSQCGYEMLKGIVFLQPVLDVVRYHHERFNGTGYPQGLSGHDIPLSARIFMVADAYDAMTNDRPYRKAMDPVEALAEIERCTQTQFDPDVVVAFKLAFTQGWVEPPHIQ